MITKEKIQTVLQAYDPKNVRIGVLGSHSALEIAAGAKEEGFETVVVCQNGREKTYALLPEGLMRFLSSMSSVLSPLVEDEKGSMLFHVLSSDPDLFYLEF